MARARGKPPGGADREPAPARSAVRRGYWVRWSCEERAWEATWAVDPCLSVFGSTPELALSGLREAGRLVIGR